MKFQLNLVAALLAASSTPTPSVAARLKYHREGGLKLKKSIDELNGGRRLNDLDVASMMAELNSVPEIEYLRGGKRKDSSPQCYIGLEFLDRLDEDPDAICCNMPPLYYATLQGALNAIYGGFGDFIVTYLPTVGCLATTTRPDCYSTGTQISFWQLNSLSGLPHVDYPVCDGAVISPGVLFDIDGAINFPSFVAGYSDSPVIVSVPGVQLTCEGDCTFNGGQFQILSIGAIPFAGAPGGLIPVTDISGLTIEGFTFTGTMESTRNMSDQRKYSIFLAAKGEGIEIKNNVFKDISNPIKDGIDCNNSVISKGYCAVFAGQSEVIPVNLPGTMEIEVTIQDNVFENIDVGSYPVYANNPKECNFCFKDTNMKIPNPVSFIVNGGQVVNLYRNTLKKILASNLYLGSHLDGCDTKGSCYSGEIEANIFKKNDVHALFTLTEIEDVAAGEVVFSDNEGECEQRYLGMYCPVRRYGKDSLPVQEIVEPYKNCDDSEFCYTEYRALRNSQTDAQYCGPMENI